MTDRLKRWHLALLVGSALALALAAVAAADREIVAPDRGRHLLLDMVRLPDGRFEVLHTTVVHSGLPKRRGLGRAHPWRFALIAGGRVLHEDGLQDPAVIRGEFHHPDDPGRIQAFHLRRQGPVRFSIRVPLIHREARLEFHALRPGMERVHPFTAEAYQTIGRASLTPLGED